MRLSPFPRRDRTRRKCLSVGASKASARLDQIINLKHELVQLSGKIDWNWIDREIAPLYSDKGRPGVETRFVATPPTSSSPPPVITSASSSPG